MTLVVAVTGPESIWLLADRRLSRKGLPPQDDGCKLIRLDTADGAALLGYAGLGETVQGMEPADWMSNVLRGRDLTLEQSLGVLATAMREQFPRHMVRIPGAHGPEHHVLVPAFLGKEPMLYTIGLCFTADRKRYEFRFERQVRGNPPVRTPRIAVSGSGLVYLKMKDRKWVRDLLRVVRACDSRKVAPRAVADHLAGINYEVHQSLADKTVGPSCIVAWSFRKGGVYYGGGGRRFYTGTTGADRDAGIPFSLPMITQGIDLRAIFKVMMSASEKHINAIRSKGTGEPSPKFDTDEVDAELSRLPDKPDEKLR